MNDHNPAMDCRSVVTPLELAREAGVRNLERRRLAEARVDRYRWTIDAAARALDPDGGCVADCTSIIGRTCDCGYVEAVADPGSFLRRALADRLDTDPRSSEQAALRLLDAVDVPTDEVSRG